MTAFAAFDLDGTLYSGHIVPAMSRYYTTHRVKLVPLFLYMATHLPLWPLGRLGLVSEERARELSVRDLPWTLRGWTPREATPVFKWVAEHYVLPAVRPDVMSRLQEHQASGDRVIIVSGTPAPLLAEIGRVLGVEDTVGTRPVLRKGRYTGASELPVCQGAGKVIRLEQLLADDEGVSWDDSYAYADSYGDLPLLERVGHPVAVYPDEGLAAYARAKGWGILSSDSESVVAHNL